MLDEIYKMITQEAEEEEGTGDVHSGRVQDVIGGEIRLAFRDVEDDINDILRADSQERAPLEAALMDEMEARC